MIITLLALGLIGLIAIAVIGKMFTLLLSIGLLLVVAAAIARLSISISTKQALIAGGIGLAIALASFLLLFI